MIVQVVGRISGKGLTSIWESQPGRQNILQKEKYYAEMKPFSENETAFLYSARYGFIAAGNRFDQTATESRSHAVNYFLHLDAKEMKQFQNSVPIDFKRAEALGDESAAQQCGQAGFLRETSGKPKCAASFSLEEQALLVQVICHLKNGLNVNISCGKKKERRLFTTLIQLFPQTEIGLNINLGCYVDIAINSKVDAVPLQIKSGTNGTIDIPFAIKKQLSHMEKAQDFLKKLDTWPQHKEMTVESLNILAEEKLEEEKWEELGVRKMVWPLEKPDAEDALMMQRTLMEMYFACESFRLREEKFSMLQNLYKNEILKMIDVQKIKPLRDKKYLALALIVCFKLSPYAYCMKHKELEQYIPAYISKREIEGFLEINGVGKMGITAIWKEIEKNIMSWGIGE